MAQKNKFLAYFLVIFFATTRLSIGEELLINTSDGPQVLYSKSYALLIGQYEFENAAWNSLNSIPLELENISTALKEVGFDSVKTKYNLTTGNLSQTIKEFLLDDYDHNTRLVVFFAGHGWSDRNKENGFIIPVDAVAPLSTGFNSQIIPVEDVINWSNRSRAKHVLFVFDSCFSGGAFLTRSSKEIHNLFFEDIDKPVRQFITSGSANEEVPAVSVFAEAFVRGIKGDADFSDDGLVSANELGIWLKGIITPGGKQTPQFGTTTNPRFRSGDVIFRAIKKSLIVKKFTNPAKDNSNSSTRKEDALDFIGTRVRYYQKEKDGTRIKEMLHKNDIPYNVLRASLIGLPVNAIACGPTTPVKLIKKIALGMLQFGIPLQKIKTFRVPDQKAGLLEIVSIPDGTQGAFTISNRESLNEVQINSLNACPTLMEGSLRTSSSTQNGNKQSKVPSPNASEQGDSPPEWLYERDDKAFTF